MHVRVHIIYVYRRVCCFLEACNACVRMRVCVWYVCIQSLGGTTCLTLLVYYGLICFMRVSSCQGSPEFATVFTISEETRVRQVVLDEWFPPNNCRSMHRSMSRSGGEGGRPSPADALCGAYNRRQPRNRPVQSIIDRGRAEQCRDQQSIRAPSQREHTR